MCLCFAHNVFILFIFFTTFVEYIFRFGKYLASGAQDERRKVLTFFLYITNLCQNSTKVSPARQCSVQLSDTFTKIAKSDY